MKLRLIPLSLCAIASSMSHASTVFYSQDFETANTGYSLDTAEYMIGSNSHFLRTAAAPGTTLSNEDGFYLSMLSTEFFNKHPTMTTDTFSIAGATDLQFAIDVASGGLSPTWNTLSNVVFEYQVDGGAWTNIFTADNDGSGGPKINGTVINGSFQTITANLSGIVGSTMGVRVFWSRLENFENLAIDNMTVAVVPLPSAAFAGLGLLAGMGVYRRVRLSHK